MTEYIERERLLRRFNIDDMMNVNGTLISLHDAREVISSFPAVSIPQWISVKDRLPEPDENPVIAGCEPFNMVFMAWYHSKTKRWELPSRFVCEVTHWMPTSSLPRMDGAE
nr:MAG TPA: Protein of unknown function (DUF551) [Caudoviricetes sp.]